MTTTSQNSENIAETNTSGFLQVETVHLAHVSWRYREERRHDHNYHIRVNDAVAAAVKGVEREHDVRQNISYCCQWEGIQLEGNDVPQVTSAAQEVIKVLARFNGVAPLSF